MKREKLFAVCLAAALLLAGCGGGGSGAKGALSGGDFQTSQTDSEAGWNMGGSADAPSAPAEVENPVYRDPNVKLIRRAELSIQTEQFDSSVEALNRLTADCGGYFETASVYGGGRRDAYASRRGEYTVRVPAENYSRFFSSAGDLGYVVNSTQSSQDVGEEYYDTQARLKTQRTKQERLLALLEKAETMEDIISLESALSEVEYQIEQYTSTLNRYDALVGFSTFRISLSEVGQVTQEVGETASLWARMAAGVQSSFRGLVRGGQDFLIWVSYNVFLLVILAAVAAAAVIVGRRRLKKPRKQAEQKDKE